MIFPNIFRLNRHTKPCEKLTKIKLPGGYYKPLKTIFDKLEEFNINVKAENRYFPWFAVFDLESILVPVEHTSGNSNRQLNYSHQPVCVCICSNVPGFEKERFILNQNIDNLLEEMCTYLKHISEKVTEFIRAMGKENVWHKYLNKLETSAGVVQPEYYEWDMDSDSNCSTSNTGSTDIGSINTSDTYVNSDSNDDDDDDDNNHGDNDDYVQPFRSLNKTRRIVSDDDDDDVVVVKPLRSLNTPIRIVSDDDDDDDDEDDDNDDDKKEEEEKDYDDVNYSNIP